jgi:hypothetical protein
MREIEEYTYGSKNKHLNDREASDTYRKEKADNPGAIVTLEELDCGHWNVSVYATPSEKEALLYTKMIDMVNALRSVIRK